MRGLRTRCSTDSAGSLINTQRFTADNFHVAQIRSGRQRKTQVNTLDKNAGACPDVCSLQLDNRGASCGFKLSPVDGGVVQRSPILRRQVVVKRGSSHHADVEKHSDILKEHNKHTQADLAAT